MTSLRLPGSGPRQRANRLSRLLGKHAALLLLLPALVVLLWSGSPAGVFAQESGEAGKSWRERLRERFMNGQGNGAESEQRPWRKKLREALKKRFEKATGTVPFAGNTASEAGLPPACPDVTSPAALEKPAASGTPADEGQKGNDDPLVVPADRFPETAVPASGTSLQPNAPGGYDPLFCSGTAGVQVHDLTVNDEKRRREIPLRVYLPPATSPARVVLFSHGLGGSRNACRYLGRYWAARGYVCVFLQHPGSDEEVWRNAPLLQRRKALTGAASGENLQARVGDVHAVLDALAAWQVEPGNLLAGRLDLAKVGMSGHSFGAQTTQAVSGQAAGRLGQLGLDRRIGAAIMFSPNRPKIGDPAVAFGSVAIPWLLMTGTRDDSPIGGATPETRQQVFPYLPPGGKYQLVLDGAEHSAFTDDAFGLRQGARNPNHHRAILAITTAFWDAWLRDSAAARAWLDGNGPRSVLEASDRWERK